MAQKGKGNIVMTPLRKVRLDKGLSRHELSMATGVPVRNIEVYEQGKINLENVAYKTVTTLADALEVAPDIIVYEDGVREV